jgi:hypothetical protein
MANATAHITAAGQPDLTGPLIALAGPLSAAALHDFFERFEIGARLAICEKMRGFQCGHFLGNGRRHKLIDAGSILFAQPFYRCLERSW